MYSQFHPWIRSELVNLLEQRIDMLITLLVTVGDKQEDQERWYQGVVRSVRKYSRQTFVIVNWDGMPDVKGWEGTRESTQQLLPSLYNKDNEGAWRMDVSVKLCEAYDSENDECVGSDNEIISYDNEMSEGEDNIDNSEEGLSDDSDSDDGNYRSSDKKTIFIFIFTEEIQIQDKKLRNIFRRCNNYIRLFLNECNILF